MKDFLKPCCPKVLPLVYDDSLSYYEQICKLTKAMNNLAKFVEDGIEGKFTDLIDKYFNTIMIDAIYDADSETITLKRNEIVGGDTHVYSFNDKAMIIE